MVTFCKGRIGIGQVPVLTLKALHVAIVLTIFLTIGLLLRGCEITRKSIVNAKASA